MLTILRVTFCGHIITVLFAEKLSLLGVRHRFRLASVEIDQNKGEQQFETISAFKGGHKGGFGRHCLAG